jgi:signal transduction histidine kinase
VIDRNSTDRGEAYGGVRKYRLTLVFLAVSAVMIGLASASISIFATRTAESNFISLARSQASRDTKLIAEIVTSVMETEPVIGGGSSGGFAAPGDANYTGDVTFGYPELLSALNVVEVQLFDLTGRTVWISNDESSAGHVPQADLFAPATSGLVVSELRRGGLIASGSGPAVESDVVRTYIPVISSTSGEPAAVLSVARDVTADLAAHTGQLRASLMKTTMLTLGGVFLALLGVVLAADRKIWAANNLALESERGRSERLGREKDELARKNDSTSKFMSVFSHESMTPLASTLAFVELVLRNKDGNLTKSQLQQLEVARRNSQRLVRLMSDLADASRGEKTASIQRVEFDSRAWIEFAAQEMAPALQAKSQALRLTLPPPGQPVFADRDRMTQVLVNLISNASKYSMAGTEIQVTGMTTAEELTLSVADHGIGMSADDQKHLFTLGYRADNDATRQAPGSGIGLVVAREIVRIHGGEISVESAPGVGTKVTFHIPRGVRATAPGAPQAGQAASAA